MNLLLINWEDAGVPKVLKEEEEVTQEQLKAVDDGEMDLFCMAGDSYKQAVVDGGGGTEYTIDHWAKV